MCNLKTWWWHLSDIEPKTGDLLVFLLNKSFYIKIGDKIYTFFDIPFCNIKAHTHVVYIALYNALLRKHTQKSQLITPTPKPIFFFFFAAYDKKSWYDAFKYFWKTKFQRIHNTKKFQKNTLMRPNIGVEHIINKLSLKTDTCIFLFFKTTTPAILNSQVWDPYKKFQIMFWWELLFFHCLIPYRESIIRENRLTPDVWRSDDECPDKDSLWAGPRD